MPQRHRSHSAITYAGFLDKNRVAHGKRFSNILTSSHLLLLPSRGDCTPMVIAEAMSHGTPVLTADTGGVRSLIANGAGRMLPQFVPPDDWKTEIQDMIADLEAYAFCSKASFDHAQLTLSWDRWAYSIMQLVQFAHKPMVRRLSFL